MVTDSASVTIPGLQRTTSLRYVLRCARETVRFVIAGLVPAIPIVRQCPPKRDARDEPGHDEVLSARKAPQFSVMFFNSLVASSPEVQAASWSA